MNQLLQIVLVKKFLDGGHPAVRIDVVHPLLQCQHLGLAQRTVQCLDLPVDVGQRDMVEIDQRDVADPTARQRLGRPGADAAHPDHRYAAAMQHQSCAITVQAVQSAEAAPMVFVERVMRVHSVAIAW